MVLAAGLGTRLRPLTDERPKPAVPVANRPLAWFALDHLARFGVHEVVLNAHHLPRTLETHLRPHLPEGPGVCFVHEGELLGTGGGIRNAAEHLLAGEAPVVVMNGDILFGPDLAAALDLHRRLHAVATMVVRPDPQAEQYGAVQADAWGRVRRLLGKPRRVDAALGTYMFTGVHILSRRAFEYLPERGDIVRESYRYWVDEGFTVGAFVDEAPWRDLGTPASYLETNLDVAAGRLEWPDVQPDPDTGVVVHPNADVDDGVALTESVVGSHAWLRSGIHVHRAVVWDGARVDQSASDVIVTPTTRLQVR